MLGGDFLSSLDRRRADVAGEALSAVPTPASTTAAGLAGRFTGQQLVAVEDGVAELVRRVVALLPDGRRRQLLAGPVSIDLDGTDVQCYGAGKDGVAYTYKGQRAGRPHIASWAEAGVVLAADLLAGDEDPRPGAAGLITDTVATLRMVGVRARPTVRADVGYFAAHIAWAAFKAGCDFSLGVTRNSAVWRALSAIPEHTWVKATRMRGAQVAVRPTARPGGHRAPDAWYAGSKSTPQTSRPTRGRGGGAPSRTDSSPWPWKASAITPTPTRSSSPTATCPPPPGPWNWRRGTGCAPTSRTVSGMPSMVPPCGTCPRATAPSAG